MGIRVPYADVTYVKPAYVMPVWPLDMQCPDCGGTGENSWYHLFDPYDGESMIAHVRLCEDCRGCGWKDCNANPCTPPVVNGCNRCDGLSWMPRAYGPDGEEIWVKIPCEVCKPAVAMVQIAEAGMPVAPEYTRARMRHKAAQR